MDSLEEKGKCLIFCDFGKEPLVHGKRENGLIIYAVHFPLAGKRQRVPMGVNRAQSGSFIWSWGS